MTALAKHFPTCNATKLRARFKVPRQGARKP